MTIPDKIRIIQRTKIEDTRGWFLKVIDGKEEGLPPYTGEVYLTMARPGESKGGHYHLKANEWFTLLQGACIVQLYDLSTKEQLEFEWRSEQAQTLYVPHEIAHNFRNTSDTDFLLLAYSDQLFDPADTIPWTF